MKKPEFVYVYTNVDTNPSHGGRVDHRRWQKTYKPAVDPSGALRMMTKDDCRRHARERGGKAVFHG